MKTLAFIPARGGSKRLPGKNLREVGGVSLVRRAVESAWGAGISPYVSGDDWKVMESAAALPLPREAIARVIERSVAEVLMPPGKATKDVPWPIVHGLGLHARPTQLADDHARVDDAIKHWWQHLDDKPDVIVLLQPTSPLRTATHVREALQVMRDTDADTVVSVCRSHTHRFAGRLIEREVYSYDNISTHQEWQPLSFVEQTMQVIGAPAAHLGGDVGTTQTVHVPALLSRPRTQDVATLAHENGAIYIVTREHFERTGSLHGGDAYAYVMDRWSSIDVDDEDDLALAEWAERRRGG
jgi:CMP-N-acetylneuraminic acid synthetase